MCSSRGIAADEEGMVAEVPARTFVKRAGDAIGRHRAGRFVDDVEDLGVGPPSASRDVQPGELFRGGIEKGDAACGVGGDDGIGDAGERGGEPLLALADPLVGLVLVERHLDAGLDRALFERLDQEAERPRCLSRAGAWLRRSSP